MNLNKHPLTEGDIFSSLVLFSVPFLLTNILQACYGASDLFMVGRFADSVGVSAVATGSQIMQMITSLAVGLTTGGTVLIAQHYGAKKVEKIAESTYTILIIFGIFALILTCFTILSVDKICIWMHVPATALKDTHDYLLISSFGILFIVGFNTLGSILRGLGDSKTPFYLMVIACFINISTDVLFVGVMKQGAQGSAVSTVLAECVSLFLAAFILYKKGFITKFRGMKTHFDSDSAKKVLSIGLPIACQEGLVNISFLIITSIINCMGIVASAAVGVVEKLIVFSMLPVTAFASAVAAASAQNYGAGLYKRAKRSMHIGILLSMLFGLTFFLCAQIDSSKFLSIFSNDSQVIQAGALYLRAYSFDCILVSFVFCMNSYFSGCGNSLFPLIHSLIATFFVRVPVSYIVSRISGSTMFTLGLAAPMATFVSLVLCVVYMRKSKINIKKGNLNDNVSIKSRNLTC